MGLPALPAVVSPGPPAVALPAPALQPPPHYESSLPGCPFLPLQPVSTNVSLTPWLSDFIQFDFLSVLVVFVLKFVVAFLLVVQESKVYLPIPSSGSPELFY